MLLGGFVVGGLSWAVWMEGVKKDSRAEKSDRFYTWKYVKYDLIAVKLVNFHLETRLYRFRLFFIIFLNFMAKTVFFFSVFLGLLKITRIQSYTNDKYKTKKMSKF